MSQASLSERTVTAREREASPPKRPSAVRRLLRNPSAVIGLIIVVGIIGSAILAPYLAPYSPLQMGAGKALMPPSWAHPLGTDEFGRDMLSRVIFGARLTLKIGLIAVGISFSTGLLIGVIGGYAGGWVERVLMRAIDVLFSFTETLIALAAVAVLGPSLTNAMIAVGIAAIPFYARIAHAATIAEKNKMYFEAGTALGASHVRLMFTHVLPNILSPLIVVASMGVSTAILAAAGLSYLGLGAQPPSPEWGAMLAAGQNYFTRAPWLMTFPGVAISVSVLGFNLLGDALQQVLDPHHENA